MSSSLPMLQGSRIPDIGNIVFVRSVDSTNRLARHIVAEYLREELEVPRVLILAGEQHAGRGRQGRTWESPLGEGLYATLLWPEAHEPAMLPLLIPTALAEGLNSRLHDRCGIKWPNDLVVGGAKVGGVLIELVSRGEATPAPVLGFGINHGEHLATLPGATSLQRELGSDCPSLQELASELAISLTRTLTDPADRGRLVERYRRLLVHRPGDEISCQLGDRVVQGIFEGIDEQGHLLLQGREGKMRVAAGEIVQ